MRWLALGTAVLGVFIWRSGRVARHTILTKSAFPVGYYASGDFATSCSPIAPADDPAFNDLKYCEDETFWDVWNGQGSLQTRHLILSCDSNRKAWNTVMGPLRDPKPRGSLWLNTLTSNEGEEDAIPVRMVFQNYPEGHDFHPLGLEVSPSHAGNTSNLFVVNHARQRTTIEHFSVDPLNPTIALYLRTLSTPYFVSPNSIALTSPTSFYVTNDHFFTRRLAWVGKFLPITESILALPLGWVAHVALIPNPLDPSGEPIFSHTVSALGIPFANGIALSPDGSTVAVASTTLGEVYFYQREPKDNTIKRIDSVPVPFTPDNIAFDDSGVLIVTGHPHFPSIVGVAANKTEVAPSWTVAVVPRSSVSKQRDLRSEYDTQAPISAGLKAPAVMSHEVETLFQSNGTGFSTSSTALRDARSGRLYLTGLYAENGAIVCRPFKKFERHLCIAGSPRMSFTNLYKPKPPPAPVSTEPTDEPYDINFAYPLNLDILQTPKIKLIPFIPSVHAVPFYAAATKTPETMRFIPFHFAKLDDFLVNVVGPFQASPDYLLLTIIDKLKLEQGAEEKDCIAGVIGYLGMSTMRRSVELGPVIVLPEYQRTHVSTHAIGAAMRYVLEVPAQGGLGWRRVQWSANTSNAASVRSAERMGMKVEAAAMRWSFCLQEEKEGIVVPAERGGGKGRHSTLLAVCWDDWENGIRDHVTKLIARER